MTSSVLNGDIMIQNGVFWTIGGHSYFVYYLIISYQSIKVYRLGKTDMGRFLWNNGVGGKFNPRKYCGIYCTG